MNILKGIGRGEFERDTIEQMLEVNEPKFKFYHSLEDPENLLLYNCQFDEKDVKFKIDEKQTLSIKKFFSF